MKIKPNDFFALIECSKNELKDLGYELLHSDIYDTYYNKTNGLVISAFDVGNEYCISNIMYNDNGKEKYISDNPNEMITLLNNKNIKISEYEELPAYTLKKIVNNDANSYFYAESSHNNNNMWLEIVDNIINAKLAKEPNNAFFQNLKKIINKELNMQIKASPNLNVNKNAVYRRTNFDGDNSFSNELFTIKDEGKTYYKMKVETTLKSNSYIIVSKKDFENQFMDITLDKDKIINDLKDKLLNPFNFINDNEGLMSLYQQKNDSNKLYTFEEFYKLREIYIKLGDYKFNDVGFAASFKVIKQDEYPQKDTNPIINIINYKDKLTAGDLNSQLGAVEKLFYFLNELYPNDKEIKEVHNQLNNKIALFNLKDNIIDIAKSNNISIQIPNEKNNIESHVKNLIQNLSKINNDITPNINGVLFEKQDFINSIVETYNSYVDKEHQITTEKENNIEINKNQDEYNIE